MFLRLLNQLSVYFFVNNIYFHVMIDVVSRKLQIAVFISLLVTDFDCSHEKYSIIMWTAIIFMFNGFLFKSPYIYFLFI